MVEAPSLLQGTNTRPCSVCGAVGYEECLCSCSQCNSSVHVYCMRIFLKKVPERWICEDCQSRNRDCTSSLNKRQKVKVSKVKFITADEAIMLTSGATKEPLVRKYAVGRSHLASIMASKKISVDSETIGPKSSPFKRPPDRSYRSYDRRVHFSIPAASPLRELKETRISKGHQKQNVMNELPMKCPNLPSGPGDSIRKTGNAICVQSFASSPLKICPTVQTKSKLVKSPKAGTEHRYSKKEGEVASSTNSKLSGKDQVKAFEFSPEDKTSNRNVQMVIKREHCTSSPEIPCVPTDLPVPTKSKLRRADQLQTPMCANKDRTPNREVETVFGKVSSTISLPRLSTPTNLPDVNAVGMNSFSLEKALHDNLSLSSTSCSCLHAVDATWKGSFRVLRSAGGRLYEGFQAHPPLIVHRKAYEFSKKMPALLHFNFLPISTLWMELFQDDPPDENDVGLYIFPSDVARSPTDFPNLLEAMDMNHTLMKIDINGVELLIFTSKCLHVKSDNAVRGSFLWGLFRQMKDSDNRSIEDLPPGFHEKRWLKVERKLNHHS